MISGRLIFCPLTVDYTVLKLRYKNLFIANLSENGGG